MAKIRLNAQMRNELINLVDESFSKLCPKEFKIMTASYEKAKNLVLVDRLKKYPDADMLVLKKYKQTMSELHISGADPDGRLVTLSLNNEDAPLRPDAYAFSNTVHPFRAATAKAIDKYILDRVVYDTVSNKAATDFYGLIAAYKTVEDVVEVWPASLTVLQDYLDAAGRSLPTALPESALARIRKLNIG